MGNVFFFAFRLCVFASLRETNAGRGILTAAVAAGLGGADFVGGGVELGDKRQGIEAGAQRDVGGLVGGDEVAAARGVVQLASELVDERAAALGGATFVVLCDVLCRVIPGRSEVPLGVITGLIGAPTFLWLLLQHRRESYAV